MYPIGRVIFVYDKWKIYEYIAHHTKQMNEKLIDSTHNQRQSRRLFVHILAVQPESMGSS